MKKFANARVRTFCKDCYNEINDGSSYKKLFCSWDIHDYAFYFGELQCNPNRQHEYKALMMR